MKPILKLKPIIIPLSVLTLGVLMSLSTACQRDDMSSDAASQNQAPRAVPGNSQVPPGTPNTNHAANNNVNVNSTAPGIQITVVPTKGAGPEALEAIAGTVSGVKVNECKVVIFARTNTWYVQPYMDAADTSINDDGTWRNDTHLGLEYAALLVKSSYKPPKTTGKLPAVGGLILAVATAKAKE